MAGNRTAVAIVIIAVVVGALYFVMPTNIPSFVAFLTNFEIRGIVMETGQAGDGRELRLLEHVRASATQGNASDVVAAIDTFAKKGSWLMNIGDVKGQILDTAVANASAKRTLELGTYMSYGSLRIANTLGPDAVHYSVEAFEANYVIAKQIVAHAGMADKIKLVHGTVGDNAIQQLRDLGATSFDVIFLDHWKDLYIPDLKKLLAAGMLRPGGTVVADNVLVPGAPEYRKWMNANPEFSTQEFRTNTEYINFLPDIVMVSKLRGGATAKAASAA